MLLWDRYRTRQYYIFNGQRGKIIDIKNVSSHHSCQHTTAETLYRSCSFEKVGDFSLKTHASRPTLQDLNHQVLRNWTASDLSADRTGTIFGLS